MQPGAVGNLHRSSGSSVSAVYSGGSGARKGPYVKSHSDMLKGVPLQAQKQAEDGTRISRPVLVKRVILPRARTSTWSRSAGSSSDLTCPNQRLC